MKDLLLTATIQARDGKTARVSIMAYGGGVMSPPGFGPTIIDLAGLQASGSVTLLADHENQIGSVVGSGKAHISAGQLFVDGTLSAANEVARTIIQLHKDGVALQASVGARPLETKRIKAGETVKVNGREITATDDTLLVVRAQLLETTITPLGADRSTTVDIAANQGVDMAAAATDQTIKTEKDPVLAERERIKEIRAACADLHGVDRDRLQAIEKRAIDAGLKAGDVSSELLALLRASRSSAPAIHANGGGVGHVSVAHIEAAMLCKAGYEKLAEETLGARVLDESRHLHAAHTMDIGRAALAAEGRAIPSSPNEIIKATFSTMTLPTALSNMQGKVLERIYRNAPATWRSWCATRNARDFKDQTSIRPSFVGELEELAADGHIKHGRMNESFFQWNIDTFAKMTTITRKDWRNDDVGIFDDIPQAFANMGLRKIADLVYETLFAATSAYFDAALNNLTTAAPLSVTTLGNAIAKMRQQRDDKNNDLDIQPATLLVSPELEETAKAALNSEFTERIASNTAAEVDVVRPTGNPQRQAVKLEVESRLSNTDKFASADADRWYLFARPVDLPMVVGFLDGKQSPTVEFFGLDHVVDQLGVSWRIYHDFGAALGDYRAAQRVDAT